MSVYRIKKDDLIKNIEYIKEKANVPIIAAVKGNGYGFGIKEFSKILYDNGINMFSITEIEDIERLKSISNDIKILVMRSTTLENEVTEIVKNNCIATIGSIEAANMLDKVSNQMGVITECHIKIDTGLSRYGFKTNQLEQVISCYNLENIKITGAYTHFSSAFRNKELTIKQFNIFNEFMNKVKENVGNVGMLHCTNSPALLNVDGTVLDAVRIGSAFTGRVISNDNHLIRIGCLESNVIEIKHISKGESVGYSAQFTADKDMDIAIIPVGHFDGFGLTKDNEEITFRLILSIIKKFLKKQRMYISINEKKYNVVGKIGLSHTVVDITGSDIKNGDVAKIDISPLMINPMIPRIYE